MVRGRRASVVVLDELALLADAPEVKHALGRDPPAGREARADLDAARGGLAELDLGPDERARPATSANTNVPLSARSTAPSGTTTADRVAPASNSTVANASGRSRPPTISTRTGTVRLSGSTAGETDTTRPANRALSAVMTVAWAPTRPPVLLREPGPRLLLHVADGTRVTAGRHAGWSPGAPSEPATSTAVARALRPTPTSVADANPVHSP